MATLIRIRTLTDAPECREKKEDRRSTSPSSDKKMKPTVKVEQEYATPRKALNKSVEEWLLLNKARKGIHEKCKTITTDSNKHPTSVGPKMLSQWRRGRRCDNEADHTVSTIDRRMPAPSTSLVSKEMAQRLRAADRNGETALHLAVREGDEELVKLLLSLCPALRHHRSRTGDTAVLLAAAMGRQNMVKELLTGSECLRAAAITDINGTSVLMTAVVRGDNEMANFLLKRFGKDLLLLPNRSLMLPAHVAAGQGNVDFLKAAVAIDVAVVHCRDEFGCTPALYAVQGGRLSTLQFLIGKSKTVLHATNRTGMSLLHVACIAGHAHIVSYFLDKMGKCAITATTRDHANAVHCAAYTGHTRIIAQLLSCFSKKKRKELLASRDNRGNTPLHLAALGNYVDTVLFLIEAGAKPSLLNLHHQTAREVALLRGHCGIGDALLVDNHTMAPKKRRSLAVPTQLRALVTRSAKPIDGNRYNASSITQSPRIPSSLDAQDQLTDDASMPVQCDAPAPASHSPSGSCTPISSHVQTQPSSVDHSPYLPNEFDASPSGMMKSSSFRSNGISSGYSSAGESWTDGNEFDTMPRSYICGSEISTDEKKSNDAPWISEGLSAVYHFLKDMAEITKEYEDNDDEIECN